LDYIFCITAGSRFPDGSSGIILRWVHFPAARNVSVKGSLPEIWAFCDYLIGALRVCGTCREQSLITQQAHVCTFSLAQIQARQRTYHERNFFSWKDDNGPIKFDTIITANGERVFCLTAGKERLPMVDHSLHQDSLQICHGRHFTARQGPLPSIQVRSSSTR
jgi:hypothetical protein